MTITNIPTALEAVDNSVDAPLPTTTPSTKARPPKVTEMLNAPLRSLAKGRSKYKVEAQAELDRRAIKNGRPTAAEAKAAHEATKPELTPEYVAARDLATEQATAFAVENAPEGEFLKTMLRERKRLLAELLAS